MTPLDQAAVLLVTTPNALRDVLRRIGARRSRGRGTYLDSDTLRAAALYRLGRERHRIPGSALASAAHAVAHGRSDAVKGLRFASVMLGERSRGWRLELAASHGDAPKPASVVPVADLLSAADALLGAER